MRHLPVLVLLLSLLLGAPAMAQSPPTPNAGDPRLRTIQYDAGQVFRLRVATGFQSTIIFNPDERVENVGIGDSDGWQVTLNSRGDALFLKPVRANSATNMTVITDARVYSFELSSAHSPGADAPVIVASTGMATSPSATAGGSRGQPTLHVDAGARIGVFVARDLEFSSGEIRR